MNKAHNPPLRSLLDPPVPVAWPDTMQVFCIVTSQKHLVDNETL